MQSFDDSLQSDRPGTPGQTGVSAPTPARGHLRKRARLMAGLLFLLVLMGVNLAIGSGKLRFEQVTSASMEPTLNIGDVLLCDGNAAVNRFDVIVLDDPLDANGKLVKRIMGMPGDQIRIESGVLYIKPLGESRFKEEYSALIKGNQMVGSDGRWTVPDDQIFVMGDNRNNSADSRSFGPVPLATVRGVVKLVFWPAREFRTLPAYASEAK